MRRVYVVDDDESLRKALSFVLNELCKRLDFSVIFS